MKFCPKCQTEKSIDLFCDSSIRKNGKASWCRACDAAKHQARKRNNPEKVRAQGNATATRWRENNPDKAKEICSASAKRKWARHRILKAQKQLEAGEVLVSAMPGYKKCADCKEIKDCYEFDNCVKTYRGAERTDLYSYCRDCQRERGRQMMKRKRDADPQKSRDYINARRRTDSYKEWEAGYRTRDHVIAIRKMREAMRFGRRGSLEGRMRRHEWAAVLERFSNSCCYCGDTERITLEHLTPVSRGGSNAVGNIAPACWPCNSTKRDKLLEEFVSPERATEIRALATL